MRNLKISKDLMINNKFGIHARPAAMLVRTATRFKADITVEKGNIRVSGKSILGIMTMEAGCGTSLRVIADGTDAKEAIEEIEKLFANSFYEE